jgi:predicted transglutaminase-like cysteine proteinase
VTLKVAALTLRPFHVEHLTITATRQPDKDGHRVYRVKTGNQSSDIVLGADGWPVSTATLTRI